MSELEDSFLLALQQVLQSHLPHEKALTIWLEVRDLSEFAALFEPPTEVRE